MTHQSEARFSFSNNSTLYVAVLYAIVVVFFTGTLLLRGNQALIGEDYSGALPLWSTWWPAHALSHNFNVVSDSYILYPIETNYLPVLSFVTSFLYTVLRPIFGVFLGYHLILPIFLFANAFFSYIFFSRLTASRIVSVTAGFIIAFNPFTWQLATRGEFAQLGLFVLPLALLAWDRLVERPSLQRLMQAVVAIYLIVVCAIQFWDLLLALWLPYAAYRLWRTPKRDGLIDYALLGILCLGLLLAIFPGMAFWGATYMSYYDPIQVFQGQVVLDRGWFTLGILGVVVAALLVPWSYSPHRRFWTFLITFNGLLMLAEFTPLNLLNRLLNIPQAPVLTHPAFLAIPITLATLVLIVGAFTYMLRDVPTNRQIVLGMSVAVAIVLFSGWRPQLPITNMPNIDIYRPLADDPENYLILDYPIGVTSLAPHEAENESILFGFPQQAAMSTAYVPVHGKRILGGVVNVLPNDAAYEENPIVRLAAYQSVEMDNHFVGAAFRAYVSMWRLGYVFVHPGDADVDHLSRWMVWTGTLCMVNEVNGVMVWRARWHPAGCPEPYTIDIGSSTDSLAIGTGWYGGEDWGDRTVRWAGVDSVSTLQLWTIPGQNTVLQMEAIAPEGERQSVEVWVNGILADTISLDNNWQTYVVQLPMAQLATADFLEIELRHEDTFMIEGRVLTAVYSHVILTD